MPVDEEQAEATPLAQGEHDPEKDAAIASQDQGKAREIQREGNPFGELEAELADRNEIQHARGWIRHRITGRNGEASRVAGLRNSFEESCCLQGFGESVDAGTPKTEIRRRVDNRTSSREHGGNKLQKSGSDLTIQHQGRRAVFRTPPPREFMNGPASPAGDY